MGFVQEFEPGILLIWKMELYMDLKPADFFSAVTAVQSFCTQGQNCQT